VAVRMAADRTAEAADTASSGFLAA
jgi:hypothetical protein